MSKYFTKDELESNYVILVKIVTGGKKCLKSGKIGIWSPLLGLQGLVQEFQGAPRASKF